jgi:hypothetical protein
MLLCPYCQGAAKPLPTLNSVSVIDFFQCDGCAKLSERPKGTGGSPLPLFVTSSTALARVIPH